MYRSTATSCIELEIQTHCFTLHLFTENEYEYRDFDCKETELPFDYRANARARRTSTSWYGDPLCWNILPGLGYCNSCIIRRTASFKEYDEFMSSLRRNGGFGEASTCCYGSCFAELTERESKSVYLLG
jgi:hypothetical protein